MIKIDLITGFLGSGKTTFINEYVKYLVKNNEKICILENDYGAVNIDLMIIKNNQIDCEMIQGGSDYYTHYRRFKTKLISLANKGYTRIIVEPSGIYDTDEFFDVLNDEPILDWYQVGNIFCMYDIKTKDLSKDSEYIFVSEAAKCSKLIVTKRDNNDGIINLEYINQLMKKYNCDRVFDVNDIVYNDSLNFDSIINSGYKDADYLKRNVINSNSYESVYILNKDFNINQIEQIKLELFESNRYGNILRIKGFIYKNNKWYLLNLTKEEFNISEINEGQKVIIVIGENINKSLLNEFIESISV